MGKLAFLRDRGEPPADFQVGGVLRRNTAGPEQGLPLLRAATGDRADAGEAAPVKIIAKTETVGK